MEWLTQLTAKDVGGVFAVLLIAVSSITYVIRFIHTFTTKLEEQGVKQDERIAKLEADVVERDDLLAKKNRSIWFQGEQIASLRRMLIENGIDPPPNPPNEGTQP